MIFLAVTMGFLAESLREYFGDREKEKQYMHSLAEDLKKIPQHCIIAHICGSSSDVNAEKKILFIEHVGEYIYNIDRMLHQLKRSGKLDDLAGLVVGKFTDMKDTAITFGQTTEEVIYNIIKDYEYPVCFGFPVSHDKENYALKIGVKYELTVSATSVQLEEF